MRGFADFSPQTSIHITSIIFLAGLVQGSLGLGFLSIAIPFFVLQTDVFSAVLINLFPTLSVNWAAILFAGGWWKNLH